MGVRLDLVNQKFQRWTAIAPARTSTGNAGWLCRCECGNEAVVQTGNLRNGTSGSCGCLKSEQISARKTKHGHRSRLRGNTPEYNSWIGMICRVRKYATQPSYVKASLAMDPRWNDFEVFLADMNTKPTPDHSIDRIDNTKGYWPTNCRWATRGEQARNTSTNRFVDTPWGSITIAEFAERLEVPYSWLYTRLVTTPRPISTIIQLAKEYTTCPSSSTPAQTASPATSSQPSPPPAP